MTAIAPTEAARPREPGGIVGNLASTDHKRLGAAMLVIAFVFFIAAGILALLMRSELAMPGMQIVSEQGFDELFTIHGSTMFYLFATPAALATGVYFVPLQIGAARLAWSRVALGGMWLIISGGIAMWAGWLTTQGAADVGWYGYPPLSDAPFSPTIGTDYWIFGVILAAAAAILIAASILATVVSQRAPGMTMLRMPVFTWTQVVICLMILTAFPALIVAMSLLFAQRHLGGVYTLPTGPITYQHLFWFFGHPVVYVVFFPFVGAVAESIATFSGRRWFGYRPFVISLLLFAALSMSVWGHHMFTTGKVADRYFAFTSTALIVPAGIEYFDSFATMWRGRIRLTASMHFALGFLVLFVIGGTTGIWTGSPPLDYHVTDSYFIVAHFHYTLFGGSVMGLFAGTYLWFPKVTGRMLDERLGKIHFWLTMVGVNVTFIPMFFLGEDGMPRRIANYAGSTGWTTLNDVATAGSGVIGISILVFIANVFISWRRNIPAGPDPWGGHTLEWATSSPPPRHNFDSVPPVRSHAPLLDLREQEEDRRGAAA